VIRKSARSLKPVHVLHLPCLCVHVRRQAYDVKQLRISNVADKLQRYKKQEMIGTREALGVSATSLLTTKERTRRDSSRKGIVFLTIGRSAFLAYQSPFFVSFVLFVRSP